MPFLETAGLLAVGHSTFFFEFGLAKPDWLSAPKAR